MITLKSPREIDAMAKSGEILAGIHVQLRDFIKPGLTTAQVDKFVQDKIEAAGAVAAQIGYEGYKYATCTSVNDEICHGFPSNYVLKDGDIVKVDFCVDLAGAISDSCWTYAVGEISPEAQQLMDVTKECLYRGIAAAKVGNRIGDIGAAIQEYAESHGYGVVRDLVGHGVGPTMHEEPMVPHYGRAGRGLRLREGMVLTIEPMINTGTWEIDTDFETGWAHKTLDGGLSCQYEHQFVITKDGPVILTSQGEEGTY